MQFPGQAKPPVGIIFDCDLGKSIDDVLAMAVLYGLDGKNECRVVSISVSNPSLQAAAMAETISQFYSGAASGAFNFAGRALPVGMAEKGVKIESPMLTEPLKRTDEAGKPLYKHGIQKFNDTGEPSAVIRNALTSQQDGNSIVICAGPATNLAATLRVKGASEWIGKKVRYLVMMGGSFPSGKPEYNFKADVAAAKQVVAEWPTPIVFVGEESGAALRFPGAAIEKEFAWSTAHPVVDAYKAFQPMPYDAPTWDMAAVLYAVRGEKEKYFGLSEPGIVTLLDDGSSRYAPAANGKHRYIIVDPSQVDRIQKTYIELASAKPVPRQPRQRRPQNQNEPPKPPAAEAKKPEALVPAPAKEPVSQPGVPAVKP